MLKPLPPSTLISLVAEKYPMIKLVTYIIGLFDPYGIDHSERVAFLCMDIGRKMNLPEDKVEHLELAALLHDVGKLGIPEGIRAKPGALTEAEYFMMKQHPLIGRLILEHMNGRISREVHAAIYHHHENWDGSGYPEGLAGNAIPLQARIIRIADTYDAITHTRGYRMPVEKDEAIQIMVRDQEAQNLFDPDIFKIFLSVMQTGRHV